MKTSTGLCALVVGEPPLGMDNVLGIAGIEALGGGVVVRLSSAVQFCSTGQQWMHGAVAQVPLVVDAPDFSVPFNTAHQSWTVTWKWTNGAAHKCLYNTVAQHKMSPSMCHEFHQELESWIKSSWLTPYDKQQHGTPEGFTLLMAVQQNNGGKVQPMLDYHELNDHITAFTADSDVCADQLCKWHCHGVNVDVLDFHKVYLQVHMDQQLWPFQSDGARPTVLTEAPRIRP